MSNFSIIRPTDPGGLPLPGGCKSCGGVNKEEYIDTGTQEEFYGAILYCDECFADMASLLGLITKEKAIQLRTKVEEQYFKNVDLNDKVNKLKGAIDGMVAAGYNSSSIDFIELDLVHLDSLTHSEPQRRKSELGERTRETSESSYDKGMVKLPADGSGLKFT